MYFTGKYDAVVQDISLSTHPTGGRITLEAVIIALSGVHIQTLSKKYPESIGFHLDNIWKGFTVKGMKAQKADDQQARKHRIDAGLDAKGIKSAELARRLNRQKSFVSSVMSGDKPGTGPGDDGKTFWEALAGLLDCEVEWLRMGTGPAPTWAPVDVARAGDLRAAQMRERRALAMATALLKRYAAADGLMDVLTRYPDGWPDAVADAEAMLDAVIGAREGGAVVRRVAEPKGKGR